MYASAPGSSRELPRRVGLWSAIAIVIGSTIGSGIFRTPSGIAAKLPGVLPMLSVWVAGGIFALCGALTLAEIASAVPETGGVYAFLRKGWGRLPAFLFGWSELVIIRAAALGAIATTFAQYLIRLLGHDPFVQPYDTYYHLIAAGAIAFCAGLNVLGVRWGAAIQDTTTIAKYGGLVLIVILALAIGLPRTGGHFTPAAPPGSFAIAPFGLALVSALWAYDGWADLSFMAGEVKDPQRNLPRALIGGTVAVVAIYLLANVAYLAVLSVDEIRSSPLVAANAAQRLVGPGGAVFVSATVMLSTFGTLNASTMTAPRIFFAMADDGLFFRSVAKVHPRYETPYVAISLAAVLGIIFVMMRTFEQLADTFVTAILPFYALGVAAIFPLRRRADYTPRFRVPGYPVVPLLFILSTTYLLGNWVIESLARPENPAVRWWVIGELALLALGIPVYFMTVGRPSAGGQPSPAAAPVAGRD